MSFRIVYTNPRIAVSPPERYEGYGLKAALYDYLPEGIGVTIELDGYALDLHQPPLKFVDFVRQVLPLAEQLRDLPPSTSEEARRFIPDISPDARIYGLLFADFMAWLPMIIFSVEGSTVSIYTRTIAESDGFPWIVWEERDRAEPVVTERAMVIDELRAFLVAYLDDLSTTFPFLKADASYRDWRARIVALQEPGGAAL